MFGITGIHLTVYLYKLTMDFFSMKDISSMVNYLFEAGELKRIKRSGWWTAKIKDPESVAEHSFRCAIVAFFLAKMEGADPQELCSAAVFHDMHETRILDLHKVAARYLDQEKAALQTERDQLAALPKDMADEIRPLLELSEKKKTILKDADLLECALQAKEYMEIGYADAEDWLINIEKRLKTPSARQLLTQAKSMRSRDWWRGLKKTD